MADKPLRVGQRVSDSSQRRKGTVTYRRGLGVRFTYMVLWDGNRHESGEYGIRELRPVPPIRDRFPIGRSVRT